MGESEDEAGAAEGEGECREVDRMILAAVTSSFGKGTRTRARMLIAAGTSSLAKRSKK